MTRPTLLRLAVATLFLPALLPIDGRAAATAPMPIEKTVARVIPALMERYGIPGMAVGVSVGDLRCTYNFGVASKDAGHPVTDNTLFEIGSESKTFTATLAAYAQATGKLSLSESAGTYLTALRGSAFGNVSLRNLGTHAAGGFPLQVPEEITDEAQLMAYLHGWKPTYAAGTYRSYSNVSIGMLGFITAKAMNGDFGALMEEKVFHGLGLKHTFLHVPKAAMGDYAQGCTTENKPIRMGEGVLSSESYGVRTTAGDMLLFLQASMGLRPLDRDLRQAIAETHTGYFRVGAMTQDLIWEQYAYPVSLADLLAGNSEKMIYGSNPVIPLVTPLPPQESVLINKTGSTNGFSAYVAFVPREKIGIVLFANKSYPIHARVMAAFQILMGLTQAVPGS